MISDVESMVQRFKKDVVSQELELRIGSIVENSFVPGVTQCSFDQLEKDMNECGALYADHGFKEVIDYYYMGDAGTPIRTRVEYDTQSMKLISNHIVKTSQAVLDVNDGEASELFPQSACRVALATEIEVESPQMTLLTHVRIKQRKCYTSKHDGHTVWRYELSKTWSASTRDAVEHMQQTMEPRYEVECELIDESREYVARHDSKYIVESLIMKVKSLMGWDPKSDINIVSKPDFNMSKKRK